MNDNFKVEQIPTEPPTEAERILSAEDAARAMLNSQEFKDMVVCAIKILHRTDPREDPEKLVIITAATLANVAGNIIVNYWGEARGQAEGFSLIFRRALKEVLRGARALQKKGILQ